MTEFRRMDVDQAISQDYRADRAMFLATARAAHAALTCIPHPEAGPDGEALAVDLAWFGPADAAEVLVLVSATVGAAGFCGSAAQIDWMAGGGPATLPPGVAALAVHALNPHGFAWLRRVAENGVDLDRNGLDFALPLPANPDYATLADAFVPADLEPRTLAAADSVLERFRNVHGTRALDQARRSGQHTDPAGLFYGGTEPAWSTRMLAQICRDHSLATRAGVAIIDFQSGIGPHGHGEPICGHRPGEPGQARCRAWYGDSLGEPLLGNSSTMPVTGLCQQAWAREIGTGILTFVVLEFGTYAAERGNVALRDDQVAQRMGLDWNDPASRRVKAELRKFHYPDTGPWKEIVLFRSRQIIAQALAGLAGRPAGAH